MNALTYVFCVELRTRIMQKAVLHQLFAVSIIIELNISIHVKDDKVNGLWNMSASQNNTTMF